MIVYPGNRAAAVVSVTVTTPTARQAGGEAKGSPFDVDDESAYRAWREQKLAGFPRSIDELHVSIEDGGRLSGQELTAVHEALQRANFAIYSFERSAGEDKTLIRQLGRQFGLERLDDNLCADEDGIMLRPVLCNDGTSTRSRSPMFPSPGRRRPRFSGTCSHRSSSRGVAGSAWRHPVMAIRRPRWPDPS